MTADPISCLKTLSRSGFQTMVGVPCSSMTGLINAAQRGEILSYVNAPNEGEAVAFAAGRWLGGNLCATIFQNSGLGNAVNALTSLIRLYEIPTLILCGWRGRPGFHDEPQHRLMGSITDGLFSMVGARVEVAEEGVLESQIPAEISSILTERSTAALLISSGLFHVEDGRMDLAPERVAGHILRSLGNPYRLDRRRAIDQILTVIDSQTAIVATTGLIGRELFAAHDRAGNFYLMGSMGHALPLALGLSGASRQRVVVLDGDGSLLMRLSALAFAGEQGQSNLVHVVLDNGVHESTGGQPTLSAQVDFAAVAIAAGYAEAVDTDDATILRELLTDDFRRCGPLFIRFRIVSKSLPVPPRIALQPGDLALRFRAHMSTTTNRGLDEARPIVEAESSKVERLGAMT